MKLRIATFNVENLFHRTAILNIGDREKTDNLLGLVRELQGLLEEPHYEDSLKDQVFTISQELLPYIDIRNDSGSLGGWKKEDDVTGFRIYKSCTGRGDWMGEITFKVQEFSDQQRKNTGKVIQALEADILCAIEVEGMDVLRRFNTQVLGSKKYKQFVMIDSPNDPRGIDVACLTKHRIDGVRTHVFDAGKRFDPVFSRDCLEVAIDAGLSQPVFVLCNHFKSQSGKSPAEIQKSADKRRDQAEKVSEILQRTYDLNKHYVVVLGDLNEDPTNSYKSLEPLFHVPGLFPVVDPDLPAEERYTYYFAHGKKSERLNQLDHIFLSKPLHDAITNYGFERRGIFDMQNITGKEGAQQVISFPEVDSWSTAASDHAGLWVEVDIS